MLEIEKLLESLRDSHGPEVERFKDFLNSHDMKNININGKSVSYYCCGNGNRTILTFAGGWGGPELMYDTILGFEKKNRIVVVDISAFNEAEEMCAGINQV